MYSQDRVTLCTDRRRYWSCFAKGEQLHRASKEVHLCQIYYMGFKNTLIKEISNIKTSREHHEETH